MTKREIHPYPKLRPLAEVPLHGSPIEPEARWACDIGEDHPPVRYDWRCHGCVSVAEDAVNEGLDSEQEWYPSGTSEDDSGRVTVKLSWLIDRSRYWFAREST